MRPLRTFTVAHWLFIESCHGETAGEGEYDIASKILYSPVTVWCLRGWKRSTFKSLGRKFQINPSSFCLNAWVLRVGQLGTLESHNWNCGQLTSLSYSVKFPGDKAANDQLLNLHLSCHSPCLWPILWLLWAAAFVDPSPPSIPPAVFFSPQIHSNAPFFGLPPTRQWSRAAGCF